VVIEFLSFRKDRDMTSLTSLSNDQLLESARDLASQERRITNELLRHLIEIEVRRLYLRLSYSSLFLYVTKELRYSEAAAQRRIDAARLLREVPAVEQKIASGELTLGHLGKAQQFFRAERKDGIRFTSDQKQEVVLSLVGLTTKEAASESTQKVAFPLPQRRNGASQAGLLCRVPTPKALERKVRARDEHRCTWIQPNGTRCGSRWQLEIDHVIPVAKGGLTTLENLRCLCRNHNALAAEMTFGARIRGYRM
jgi:hypothetical protein